MKQVCVLLLLLTNLSTVWGGTNDAQIRDVAFTARGDGTEQCYLLMLPKGFFKPEQPHDLLIALHGHGARDVRLINREATDHATNYDDARAIFESVI